jgi:hypothetical protein
MAWLPGYEKVPHVRNEGSAYAEPSYYPYRPVILLHMTVGYAVSRSYVSGHKVPPHLWASPYDGTKYQTVRMDRAAYALYQPQFGYHWTNRHRLLLQTELVGVPEVSTATYTDAHCRWIAEHVIVPQVQWLHSIGETVDLNQVRYHANTSGSASEYWPGRMSEQEMADFNGVMCHIDAWANDHWDCSAERVDLMCQYARDILAGGLAPAAPPAQKLRSDDVHVPFTLRPGSGVNGGPYIYDGELLAEGAAVPAQQATGLTVLSSQVVASVLDFGPNKRGARAQIVWGDGKMASGGLELTSVNSYRWSCPSTGMASVVSDIPLSVHGETYAR